MRYFRSGWASALILSALIPVGMAASAKTADAQPGRRDNGRVERVQLFQWQGQVDREIRIEFDNRKASVIEVGSNERTRRRVAVKSSLPNRPGRVYVQLLEGRGRVDVVQQPSARNGYTAIVRMRDPKSGDARYRIAAYWEGESRGRGDDRRGR